MMNDTGAGHSGAGPCPPISPTHVMIRILRIRCTDSSGKAVDVLEHPGRRIPANTLQSSRQEHIEGMKSYSLQNGEPVNMISDTQFQTMDGDLLTRR
jgi:hypothetical protein